MDSIGFIKKYLPRTHDVKWWHVPFVSGIAARLLHAKDNFNLWFGVNIGIEFRSQDS
jgi:hypothetical protein